MPDRLQAVRDCYAAFANDDRALIEARLADDFRFSSPPDPALDRAGFFERCWPQAGRHGAFDFVRLVEIGDEVLVTYESERADGTRFRNTEIFGFDGADDQIHRQEVYFGWDV